MKLVFATNNANKIKEIQSILPHSIEILSLEEIGCYEDIPETSDTIEGNAIEKAEYIYKKYNCNVFADDTGLEVKVLNGKPGVYSARYAGKQRNSQDNMTLLLKNLSEYNDRTARFKTVIALYLDGKLHTFEGIAEGEITQSAEGKNGFGYDPIFRPKGYEKTFAEISTEEKNRISHRGKAIQKLVSFLQKIHNE